MSADRTGHAGRRRFAPERQVLRLARPYLKRLTGAALLAAATDFAALALMATSTWLLISAAGRPPLDTLTVAIVSVRGLAISRGVLRYTERLAGHDAVLRYITDVRTRIFAGLVGRRADVSHRSGDALSRLVSDVEDVQNLLLRVVVPAAGAVLVGITAVGCAVLVSPAAALVLAAGLLLAGVVLPLIAMRLTRHTADRVAPLRAALAVDSIDLTHGAADLAAFGATDAALNAADGRAQALARVERRLAAAGFAVDGAGVLLAGGTAAAVVVTALDAGVSGVWIGVLGVATLSAVELALVLVGAARHWVQVRGGVTRVAELIADVPAPEAGDPPVSGGPAGPAPAPRDYAVEEVSVRYRADAAPALDRVSLDLAAGRRVAVVGPSGAGKSTLLAVLTGAVHPDSGRVTARRRRPGPAPRAGARPARHRAARRGACLPRHRPGEPAARPGRRRRRRTRRRRPLPPACSTGYATSPTAGRPSSGRRARSSPAASGSASRWPGRCSPRHRCSSSTNRPKGSTPPPPTRCSPRRWRRPRRSTPSCSSPTACAASTTSTKSWCSMPAGSSSAAGTRSWSRRPAGTGSSGCSRRRPNAATWRCAGNPRRRPVRPPASRVPGCGHRPPRVAH